MPVQKGTCRQGNARIMNTQRVYNAAIDMVDRNVAEGRGAKTAFIDPARRITYAELAEGCARVAPMLASLGLGREDRIAMMMLDTVDFPVLFWGAIRAGIVPIPLNTLLTADQYRYILEDSRAKVLFVSAPLLAVAQQAAAGIASLKTIVVVGDAPGDLPRFDHLLAAGKTGAEPVAASPDEVAFWLYSSGSTGMPKGVRHVHSSAMETARLYAQNVLGIREEDVVYSAAKLFFAYGLGNAMSFPMSVGATAVLLPDRPTPQAVFAVLKREQPNIYYGVGSTEMLHIFLGNYPGKIRYGTSGVPVPGYEARLIDDNGREVGEGEIGELSVRGPTAADGYWNQREKTRRTFEGEWTRTGDKYVRDPDGFYRICGRTDDMFKVSGQWVSPYEVEAALITHPRVLEAAVVPKEDDDGLLKPKAYIVLKGDGGAPASDELREHVKAQVGMWKYPRWIEFVESLPKTATGKIQRFKLRD